MLLVVSRMKFHTERSLAISKTSDNLTSFRVPKLDHFVKASTQEFLSVISKLNIAYCLGVAHVSPQAFPMGKDIPDFNCTIVTTTQQ